MEFGSWDPQLSAMANITYGGTLLNNGQPTNDTACTTAFDQTGFMMGTSASLFNVSVLSLVICLRGIEAYARLQQQIFDRIDNTIQGFDKYSAKAILLILSRQLAEFRTRADDVAVWPNVRSFSQP